MSSKENNKNKNNQDKKNQHNEDTSEKLYFDPYEMNYSDLSSIKNSEEIGRWRKAFKEKLRDSHLFDDFVGPRIPSGSINVYNTSMFERDDKKVIGNDTEDKSSTLTTNVIDDLIIGRDVQTVHRKFADHLDVTLKTETGGGGGGGTNYLKGYEVPEWYNKDLASFTATTYFKAETFIDYRNLNQVETVDLTLDNVEDASHRVWVNLIRRYYANQQEKEFKDLLEQFFAFIADYSITEQILDELTKNEFRPGSTRYGSLVYTDTQLMKILDDKLNSLKYTLLKKNPEVQFLIAQILMLELSKFVKFESYAKFRFVLFHQKLPEMRIGELLNALGAEDFVRRLRHYFEILRDDEALGDNVDYKTERMSRAVMIDRLQRSRRVLISLAEYILNLPAMFNSIQQYVFTHLFSIKNDLGTLHADLFKRASFITLKNCLNIQLWSMADANVIESVSTLKVTSEDFNVTCDVIADLITRSELLRLSKISDFKERYTFKTTYHFDGGYDSIMIIENYKCRPDTRAFKLTSYSSVGKKNRTVFNIHEYPYKSATAVLNSIGALYEDLGSSDFVLDYYQGLEKLGNRMTGMFYPIKLDEPVVPELGFFRYAHLLAASWRDGEYVLTHGIDTVNYVKEQIVRQFQPTINDASPAVISMLSGKSAVRYIVDVKSKRIAGATNNIVRTLTDELITGDPMIYMWFSLFSEQNPDYAGSDKGEYYALLPDEFSIHDKVIWTDQRLFGPELETRWIQNMKIDKYEVRFPVQLSDFSPTLMVNYGMFYKPYIFKHLTDRTLAFVKMLNLTLAENIRPDSNESEQQGGGNIDDALQASITRQALRLLFEKITTKIESTNTLRKYLMEYANFCFREVALTSGQNIEVFRDWHVRHTYNILGLKLFHTFGSMYHFIDYKTMKALLLDFERYLPELLSDKDIFKMYV